MNKNIVALTKEGVGILGTARLLGISPTTLLSRIKKIAAEIKEPVLVKGKTNEVDELRTIVKIKKTRVGMSMLQNSGCFDLVFILSQSIDLEK